MVREELDGMELDLSVPAPFRMEFVDEFGRDERLRAAVEDHAERAATAAASSAAGKRPRESSAEGQGTPTVCAVKGRRRGC